MKPRPLYDKKTGALSGYQLRIYAGDKPDGKKIILARNWRFDPKQPLTKIERELVRRQLLFEDEVKANSAAIELQNGYEPERPFTDTVNAKEPKYSFKEFTEFWLSAQYNLKQKTLDTYESKLKRINDCFGEKALDEIESIDIVGFLKGLREEGANLRNGKSLSMKSVREYYVILKSVFDSACGWNKLDNNPMDAVSIPKSKYKKVKALTEDEAVTFYKALMEHAPAKYRAYLLLCLQTGTRRAEAGGLRWDKVMFDEKQIRIDSTVQYSPNKGIYDETPKTESSVRTLKITPEIVKALQEIKREDDAARKAMGKEWNPTGYVFTSYDGGPMHPNTPYTWLQRFQKQYGLTRCSIHQLRHTNATLLMANGIDAKSLMGHLGHTNISTTDKYLDFISEKEEQAADTMVSLFEPTL